jgi:hypothetical protein
MSNATLKATVERDVEARLRNQAMLVANVRHARLRT